MEIPILSRKYKNNVPYKLKLKSNYAQFMSIGNQLYLSKTIYLMHKNNHGLMKYLYFKEHVPYRMTSWAVQKNINKIQSLNHQDMLNLNYINELFINDNKDMYTMNRGLNEYYHIPNNNVFKLKVNVGHYATDSNNIVGEQKKISELLASDMNGLDLWREDIRKVTRNDNRYGNSIPVWQRSMNIRHYDRSNEGYQAGDPSAASKEMHVRGYNMEDIYNIAE